MTKISDFAGKNISNLDFFKDDILNLNKSASITELDLSRNKLQVLPTWIKQLENLSVINLSNNEFNFYPTELNNISELKKVFIQRNRISSGDVIINHNVNTLDLSYNELGEFWLVNSLSRDYSLVYLNLSHNRITEIPNDIDFFCPHLSILDLSYNLIQRVPSFFANLKLAQLDLQDNYFINNILASEMDLDWGFLRTKASSVIKILLDKQDKLIPQIENNTPKIYLYRCLGENFRGLNDKLRYDLDNNIQFPRGINKPFFPIEINFSETNHIKLKQDFPVIIIVGNFYNNIPDNSDPEIKKLLMLINHCISNNREFIIISRFKDYEFLRGYEKYVRQIFSEIDEIVQIINHFYGQWELQKRGEKSLPEKIILKSLSLKNIGHFENTTINFHPRLTCIIGPNGSGKTTVMRALATTILGSTDREVESRINIPVFELLQIDSQDFDQRLYKNSGNIELKYSVEAVDSNIWLNLKSERTNTIVYDFKASGLEILNSDYTLRGMILAFSQFHSKYDPNKRVVFPDTHPNYMDVTPLLYEDNKDQLEKFIQWLLNMFDSAIKIDTINRFTSINLEEKNRVKRNVDGIFEFINEFLGTYQTQNEEEKIYIQFHDIERRGNEQPELIFKTYDSPKGIPFSFISQGHKHVLSWLGRIIQRLHEIYPDIDYFKDLVDKPGVVIIDEIDTSIHPLWQSNLLLKLMTHFPNIQFIVSSHSPLCVAGLNREQIVILDATKENGDNEAKTSSIDTWVLSVEEILRKIFGTEQPKPTISQIELTKKIKETKKLLDEKEKLLSDNENDPDLRKEVDQLNDKYNELMELQSRLTFSIAFEDYMADKKNRYLKRQSKTQQGK